MAEIYKAIECIITTSVEAAFGEFETPAIARDQIYHAGITLAPGGRIDPSTPAAGLARFTAKSKNARFCDATLPAIPWQHGLSDFLLEDVLRVAAFPAPLSLTDEFTIDPVGTHIDGTPGPTIVLGGTASASDLNAFTVYGGKVKSGAAGMMIESSGWADPSNNVPMRIKDCNDAQIDIMTPYSTTGAPVAVMGALKIAEIDAAAVTINIGSGIRDEAIAGFRSRNFEIDTGTSGDRFRGVVGQVLNTLPIVVTGNGLIMLGPAPYIGRDYETPFAATKGNGTITENPAITKPIYSGADNLLFGTINGANHFAGEVMTSYNVTLSSSVTPSPDVSGTSLRQAIRPGVFDITGQTFSYLDDPVLGAAVAAIERQPPGAAGEFPFDLKSSNGAQSVWLGTPRNVMIGAAGIGEGDTYSSATLTMEAMQLNQGAGVFVIQKFTTP